MFVFVRKDVKDFLIGFLTTVLILLSIIFVLDFLSPHISVQRSSMTTTPNEIERVVFLEKGERFVDLGGRSDAPSIVTEYAPEKEAKTYIVRHYNCGFVRPFKIIEQ